MGLSIEIKLTKQKVRIRVGKYEWYRKMGLRKKKCKNIAKTIEIAIINRFPKYYGKIETTLILTWIRNIANSYKIVIWDSWRFGYVEPIFAIENDGIWLH